MIPSGARASDGFFGVVPQTKLSTADYQEMKAGGIESVRITVDSGTVAPSSSSFNFGELDRMVGDAARSGLPVLPAFYGSPGWLSSNYRTMPTTGTSMTWWKKMLATAVRRYGSNGSFWVENPSIPKVPIVNWQIWNEPNTSWFTVKPISPDRYANLVIESSKTIKAEDSRAKIMIGGLYPTPGNNGTDADRFLEQLYQVNGFQSSFDFLGVHPYAAAVQTSIDEVEGLHEVMAGKGDGGKGIYITEIGWGSDSKSGLGLGTQAAQADQVTAAYTAMIEAKARLNLLGVYWFAWQDAAPSQKACVFCYGVGLFDRYGVAKQAWSALKDVINPPGIPSPTVALPETGKPINTAVSQCVMPKLVRRKVTVARRMIKRSNCRVQVVRSYRKKLARSRAGRVLRQSPAAGTIRPAATKVRIVVARRHARRG